MKLAVISDTHDNIKNLVKALKGIKSAGCGTVIHCGDLASPFMIHELSEFKGEVHTVFGNVEGDQFTIKEFADMYDNITLHGEAGFLKIDGGEIAFTHLPLFAKGLASTGNYKYVFYGHTHRHDRQKVNGCWLVNPGDLIGLHEKPGWLEVDTETAEFTRHGI
ncbi:MAG: YfcE family phosphodiesterase [Candidatus Latescibacteria bacterium]|nr:YfcE family phosphodiesterase [bacterium]MBD3423279.1 YfcE family phosphodiesterase [Candidatus Latescibacterota bacterium]